MENKYNLDFEKAINEGYAYIDAIEDKINLLRQEVESSYELNKILNELKENEVSFVNMLEAADKMLTSGHYQEYMTQSLINYLYKILTEMVLPNVDLSIMRESLDEITEEYLIKVSEEEIDKYVLKDYDEYEVIGYRKEYKVDGTGEHKYTNEHIVLVLKNIITGRNYEIRAYEDMIIESGHTSIYGVAIMEFTIDPVVNFKPKEELIIMLPKVINNEPCVLLGVDCMSIFLADYDFRKFSIPGILDVEYTNNESMGFVIFSEELFEKCNDKQKDNRVVWLFNGDENLGKSFLGNRLKNFHLDVVDIDDILPNHITEDIIIVSSTCKFTLDEIKDNVFEKEFVEFVEVNFN